MNVYQTTKPSPYAAHSQLLNSLRENQASQHNNDSTSYSQHNGYHNNTSKHSKNSNNIKTNGHLENGMQNLKSIELLTHHVRSTRKKFYPIWKTKRIKRMQQRRNLKKMCVFLSKLAIFVSLFFVQLSMNVLLMLSTCLLVLLAQKHPCPLNWFRRSDRYLKNSSFFVIKFRLFKCNFWLIAKPCCFVEFVSYLKLALLLFVLNVEHRLKWSCSALTHDQFKTLFLIFFFFPYIFKSSSTLAQQIKLNGSNSSSKNFDNYDRNSNATNQIDNNLNNNSNDDESSDTDADECNENLLNFDSRMFQELRMHDTLLGVYRSCFQNEANEMLENDQVDDPQLICEQKFFQKNPGKKYEYILYRVIHNKNILNAEILNRIQLVCSTRSASSDLNVFDKLYLLSTYEHKLCGSIFKNSIRNKHIIHDVLNLRPSRERHHKSSLKKKRALNRFTQAPNNLLDIYFNQSQTTVEIQHGSNDESHKLVKRNSQNNPEFVNNCTLILLNTYLLAYKTECDNEGFVESLNHYDCATTNFSVTSNCQFCEEAYKVWLCTSNIPYYANGELIRPCQRYCYNVQNMCPFLRPIDDTFGGQPVFHCQNVVQASETDKTDGFEDDDENYYDDDFLDDDKCYHQCNENSFKNASIKVDLDTIFKSEIENLPDSSFSLSLFSTKLSNFSLINAWLLLKSPVASSNIFSSFANINEKKKFSMNARFPIANECIFNVPVSGASLSLLYTTPFYNELYRLLSFTIFYYSMIQRILS